jgi:lipopolysaccharide transport system ATP-binding protein
MLARLGFSVIANLDPSILLIDEVLAVGDAKFQQKCLKKMEEFKKKRVTMILVTHSCSDVERICSRAIWIDNHKVKMDGPVETVIPEYKKFFGIE